MAKVTAPLLSFGASGTIGDTQTYSTWRGVPYARRKVVPANPRSPDQTKTRTSFAWLCGLWKLAPPKAQEPWEAFAAGRQFTGRNALISKNNSALRTAADISDLIMSPGARGGLSVPAATAVGAAGTATINVTAPDLPTGWAIIEAVGWLVQQQNPQTDANFDTMVASDNATPFELDFAGVAAGTYVWGVWFKFTKPDGTYAYSPSFNGTVTVT